MPNLTGVAASGAMTNRYLYVFEDKRSACYTKGQMMIIEAMANWPRDSETDLPMVPPGEFTTFKEYPASTQPARIRKLPVLRGWFDAKRFDLNLSLPAHVGWGSVQLG